MISRRENLLRVFRHQMPEWTPIVGHVDPYNQPSREGMDPALAEALGTVRWGDESIVVFSRALGLEIMDWFSHRPWRSVRRTTAAEQTRDGDDTMTLWHTPRGELREVRRQCRDDGTSYLVEHLVKDAADLPALAAIFEDEAFELDPDLMPALTRRRALIADDGILALPMAGTPLGMLIRVHAGVATTAYLCADAPDALRDLFAVMADNHQRQCQLAAACDIDAVIGVDDTSTTTISPAMFEAFCMDYTDAMADIAHAAGKLYFHHSCGLIRDLLGLYRQTRMDAVHALCVPPLGNVTVREAKEKLDPRIVIMASATQFLSPIHEWGWVQGRVREMLEGATPGDNFVLNLAADPQATMAETQRLVDECRRYQR